MSRIIIENWTGNKVELLWINVKITKSLDNICHTLEMELPWSERKRIDKHDMIKVRYDNPSLNIPRNFGYVTTVLVDEITYNIDKNEKSIYVLGRSPIRDIIDSTWSLKPGESVAGTLFEIIKSIAAKFNITKVVHFPKDHDPTHKVEWFSWYDESPWMELVKQADNQGFIITANEAGGIDIWNIAAAKSHDGFYLTEGENITSIKYIKNGAEQYHEYIYKYEFKQETVIDDECKNNRVFTIVKMDKNIGDNDRDIKTTLLHLAKLEMRSRKHNRVTVTVPGWGLSNIEIKKLGDIRGKAIFWGLNFLVNVKISSLDFEDDLLISDVALEASCNSINSTITLVNREAYL
jgi:prophage tail gpP-like protein